MTDGLSQPETIASQNQEINSSASANTASIPEVQKPAEKMLSQSEVNELVRGAKIDGYKKAVSEYQAKQLEQQPQYEAPVQQNVQQQPQQQQYGPAQQQLTPEEVHQMVSQSMAQQQQIAAIQQNLVKQVGSGREKYSDFDAVVNGEQIPDLIVAAISYLPNGEDVLYDLAKNPSKLDVLEGLIHNPQKLNKRLMALSQTIKQHQETKSQSLPKDPLSRVQPSNVGSDNGKLSINDFKNMYRG